MDEKKQRGLDQAMASIKKAHGEGAIMRLGSNAHMKVSVISTGILPLDVALGIGGLPKGRVVEIFGPESGGKTTVALQVIAECQRQGGVAAFIDAEHALDPVYAANLGVDIDNLLVSQPDNGEQALEIADTLVQSGSIDLIVVDSVAALVPKAELAGEMGDAHVGLHARLMSQALRKLTHGISKSNTIVLFINQLREKVGVMFGNPEITTGGRALRFYSSVRMEIRKVEALKKDGADIGHRAKIKVVKNKMAPPFRLAEFDIIFGEGAVREGGIIDLAESHGIVQKSGSWYSYEGQKVGQGREQAKRFLRDNPEICDQIEAQVREKLLA